MSGGNPLATLLSQQKVKAARQECSCANCQNRPNVSEKYAWVATINENYQREVIAKMEEEKRLALAKRRAMIKLKKATKMNLARGSTNVTSSPSTNMNSTPVMCRPITNTAMNTTTTATSITTMTSSIRTPPKPTNISIPTIRPLALSSAKISERGLGSLPTTNSTTTISTRNSTSCTTTTSTSTTISTTTSTITTIRPVVQWQMVPCPYSVLSYLDRVIVTSANNATNARFQARQAPCGNDARQHYEATHVKKA